MWLTLLHRAGLTNLTDDQVFAYEAREWISKRMAILSQQLDAESRLLKDKENNVGRLFARISGELAALDQRRQETAAEGIKSERSALAHQYSAELADLERDLAHATAEYGRLKSELGDMQRFVPELERALGRCNAMAQQTARLVESAQKMRTQIASLQHAGQA